MRSGIPTRVSICVLLACFAVACGGGSWDPDEPGPGPGPAPTVTGFAPGTIDSEEPTDFTVTGSGFAPLDGAATVRLTAVEGTPFLGGTSTRIEFEGTIDSASQILGTTIPCGVSGTEAATVTVILPDSRKGTSKSALVTVDGPIPFEPDFHSEDLRVNEAQIPLSMCDNPTICCSDESVFAAYVDERSGERKVYFNRSTDGGDSWQASDTLISQDGTAAEDAGTPFICCEGLTVHVVWDATPASGGARVLFQRSLDGGMTWLATPEPLDVIASPGRLGGPVRMTCSGDQVGVIWSRRPDASGGFGPGDVVLSTSPDQGETWPSGVVTVNAGAAWSGDSFDPHILLAGASWHAFWLDARDGLEDVYTRRGSMNGTWTWDADEVRIDRGGAAGSAQATLLRVCGNSEDLHACWRDTRGSGGLGAGDVYVTSSQDGGSTWPVVDKRLNIFVGSASDVASVDICCVGEDVVVAFTDSSGSGSQTAYTNASQDRGATWDASATRITAATGKSGSIRLCASDDLIVAAWEDSRIGTPGVPSDIYINFSVDGGKTFGGEDFRVNQEYAGLGYKLLGGLCCSSAGLQVIWADSRDGVASLFQIFANSSPR